ncbi:MAG: caspase family protein [Scytonematopsis contorta HA4267-MV1]|jgi:hypothetical protein|nr:caspase family protein [Scytonematopsis contorta HA4267-MV1]
MTQKTFYNGYALLIGVGADLPVTVKDATALRDVLVNPNCAAYPQGQVELLTEKTANRQGIIDAFNRLIERVNQNPNATVIVYFSGHGVQLKSTNEYFLVPYGYDGRQRVDTAISGLEFTQKIEAIKSRKLVVLLDCCHAGGIPGLKDIDEVFIKSPVPPTLLEALDIGTGRVVVASSLEDEKSYYNSRYSYFTECLLEALQGKASVEKDGYARILDILIYLFNQVPVRSPGEQHPFVKKMLDLGENFPLCYYAGGSKFIPGELPNSEQDITPTVLTTGQRQRLQQKLEEIVKPNYNLQSQKVARLSKAKSCIPKNTMPLVFFQLEQELIEEEAVLAQLKSELEEIEQALQ